MTSTDTFEIFLATTPGCEATLAAEAAEVGFVSPVVVPGGVTFSGGWPDVWRANLVLRGANAVLARVGQFHVNHLAQLDKLAHKVPWAQVLPRAGNFAVEAACRKSKIYHAGAAAERVAKAIADATQGVLQDDAALRILVRIENNLCTLSIDTSGELLHRRNYKHGVGQAPLRETLAANLLRMAGYRGDEPVIDPMCGSGTFVIEAAEMAARLMPGRLRSFAFEALPSFDRGKWQVLKTSFAAREPTARFYGFDRNQNVVALAQENAARAGVSNYVEFKPQPVSALKRPDGARGLVIVNPPYGTRIGDKEKLAALYASLGATLKQRFGGWRVGLLTSERDLAYKTGLPFKNPGPPINHGGLRVKFYLTDTLA